MPHVKFYIAPRIVEPLFIKEGTTIGRGDAADIVILDLSLEKIHAKFTIEDDQFFIKNVGNSGFLVNDHPVLNKMPLNHGDRIVIGNKLLIYSSYERLWPPETPCIDLTQKTLQDYPLEELASASDLLFRCLTEDSAIQSIEQALPEILMQRSIDPLIIMNIEATLHESINNSARHGHHYIRNRLIHVYFHVDSEEIRVTVMDEGSGFDYASTLDQAAEHDAISAARERYKSGGYGGLGFVMMLKCLDAIEFNAKGNWVTLVKKYGGPLRSSF